jgi:thymidylate kinase
MPPPGKLIVLEGSDGSGKTTIATSLLSNLRSRGLDCVALSFHTGTHGTFSWHAHNLLQGSSRGNDSPVHPVSRHLLRCAAHIDIIESGIRPAILGGKTVILDGYGWSTWVDGLMSGIPLSTLRQLQRVEQRHWTDLGPAIVFLLQRFSQLHLTSSLQEDAARTALHDLALRKTRGVRSRIIDNNRSTYDAIADIFSFLLPWLRKSARRPTHTAQTQLPFAEPPPAKAFVPLVSARFPAVTPTIVYDTYWRFAAERQEIFFRRLRGDSPPWSSDPILRQYKFTNAYRASDRVSQYLIRNVIYDGDQSFREVFFRTILFKFFNRIETWELLRRSLGTISSAEYSYAHYETVFTNAIEKGTAVYSAAYIMPSGGRGSEYSKKHQMHLKLLERMLAEHLPERIADARTMRDAFGLLRAYPTIGDFLAYQYVTDLNYSASLDFDEMDFVVPGPGALDGVRKCFSEIGNLTVSDVIRHVAENQDGEFLARGLAFRPLWGRPLQLVDCQNIFCEIDKYSRVKHPTIQGISGRTTIKQRYAQHGEARTAWYPPKWGINDLIQCGLSPQRDKTWRT